MSLNQEKFDASIEKIRALVDSNITKDELATAVGEEVTKHTAELTSQIDALKTQLESEQGADAVRLAELESAVERLADALDGDDVEAAKEILDSLDTEPAVESAPAA